MVGHNLFWNSLTGYDVVEHEYPSCFTVVCERRHGFDPLREVINSHYDVLMS